MKLLTLQDIACYGKCSSSIAMPVLSAMGIEVTLLPTSLLSTHSAFPGFTFHDLLPDMEQILAHWESLSLHFDAIYIGYLGSQPQLDFATKLAARYPQALILVDPVMGDNGHLHKRITPEFIQSYAALCRRAHLLLPNLTEACSLLQKPYEPGSPLPYLQALRAMGAANVILTGLAGENQTVGSLCLSEDGMLSSYFRPLVPGHYHGTGDLFASVVIGGLLRGLPLHKALELATDFVVLCIQRTAPTGDADGNHWHGLRFEACLPYLWDHLQQALRTENLLTD